MFVVMRKLLIINRLVRVYNESNNPLKDKFVEDCITSIEGLPKL